MIRVTVELLPHGDESRKRLLGTAEIANDVSSETLDHGNYNVRLLTGEPPLAKQAGRLWKRGRVEDFPRIRLGPWDLLYRALDATVGRRNRPERSGSAA